MNLKPFLSYDTSCKVEKAVVRHKVMEFHFAARVVKQVILYLWLGGAGV
jgi:hypothetical protein